MGSSRFTMFKLEAANTLWREAEKNKKIEIKNEQGLSMDISLYIAEDMDKFRGNMYGDRLFGIPNDGPYAKTFFECLCNALKDFSEALTKDIAPEEYVKPFIEQEETKDGIPIELRNQVVQIGQLLQWIINSSSWRSGIYQPFDAFEIKNRVEYIKCFSELALQKDKYKENKNTFSYPSFEFVERSKVKPEEDCIAVCQSAGELIDKAIKMIESNELNYEEKFYYTAANNHFNLYKKEQLL